MQHQEWMALAVAKADGPRTLEELSAELRRWAAQHKGPFALPELTKAQRERCTREAVSSVVLSHTWPPFSGAETYEGEREYLVWLVEVEEKRLMHHVQIALLPVEVRDEIIERSEARRF